MTDLTPSQRRAFRAQAHHLNPVVTVAGNGLSDTVLAEIERSLQAHELIKVKIQGAEREDREALMREVCSRLEASPVQHIGSILVIWRQRREDESATDQKAKPARPVAKRAAGAKSARAFSAVARRTALRESAARNTRNTRRGK